MTIKNVDFVGLRVEDFGRTVEIFRDCLGAEMVRNDQKAAGFRMGDGTSLEIYDNSEPFHQFFDTGPVIGFRVDDFHGCRDALIAKGATFIGDMQCSETSFWQHFRLPNGTVLEIVGPRAGQDDG